MDKVVFEKYAGKSDVTKNHLFKSKKVIDQSYMNSSYGYPLSEEEIIIYKTHEQIWAEFIISNHEICLIIEENVSLIEDLSTIQRELNSFEDHWDIYFPFDKTTTVSEKSRKPYLLGYYWGSSVYFITRSGARLLLDEVVIKQPLDDELLELGLHNKLKVSFNNKNWFHIDFDQSYAHIGRRKEIGRKLESYTAWTIDHKGLIRRNLKILSEIASSIGIRLLLHGGTLLGCIQHNQIIPWDDDVDLGIKENEIENLISAILQDKRLLIKDKVEEKSGVVFFKVWSADGDDIENYEYKFPFIDIWLYEEEGESIRFKNGLFFPNALKRQFLNTEFEGCDFYIPYNSPECLDELYKEWRYNFVIYTWSHRLEKINTKDFKTPINTDDTGKFIEYSVF